MANVLFYARGVLETVKKLRWCPDIIHCHGWMSAIVPLFIKKAYYDEPSFRDSKVIFSVYGNGFQSNLVPNFKDQILFRDITSDDLNMIADPVNMMNYANWLSHTQMELSKTVKM